MGAVQVGTAGEGDRRDPRRLGGGAEVLPGMAAARDHLFGTEQAGRRKQGVRALRRGMSGRRGRAPALRQGAGAAAAGERSARRIRALRDPQARAGQAGRLRVCALPQGARDALRPAMVDSRCMEILEMLERTPAIVAGIAAQVPESLVTLRLLRGIAGDQWARSGRQEGVGPVAIAELPRRILDHDLAHLNEIADLLADLMPAHPMIAGLRALAAGGARSSRAA